jgi:hypothetical protein
VSVISSQSVASELQQSSLPGGTYQANVCDLTLQDSETAAGSHRGDCRPISVMGTVTPDQGGRLRSTHRYTEPVFVILSQRLKLRDPASQREQSCTPMSVISEQPSRFKDTPGEVHANRA